MASDLIIGQLDKEIWERLAGICKQHGIALPFSYTADLNDYLLISILNVTSFDLFNAYAGELEGFRHPEGMNGTKFRNLPWWVDSFWLPLDFEAPVVDNGLYVGSSFRLLSELARIRKMSPFDIAALPPGYAAMRADYTNWFDIASNSDEKLSVQDTMKWVWNALHESAQISIERLAPIWLAP